MGLILKSCRCLSDLMIKEFWIKLQAKIFNKAIQGKIPHRLERDCSLEDWNLINERQCPNCKQTGMVTTARGGAAENRQCRVCGAKYWLVPRLREAGSGRVE